MFGAPRCLVCQAASPEPFMTLEERGVPHDAQGHGIAHDYKCVSLCRDCGHGQLETHSHDCWSEDEPWDMYWWHVLAPGEAARLRGVLGECPALLNPGCGCPAHVSLRKGSDRLYAGIPSVASPRLAARFAHVRLEAGNEPRFVLVA